jgi:hypothetical protein
MSGATGTKASLSESYRFSRYLAIRQHRTAANAPVKPRLGNASRTGKKRGSKIAEVRRALG